MIDLILFVNTIDENKHSLYMIDKSCACSVSNKKSRHDIHFSMIYDETTPQSILDIGTKYKFELIKSPKFDNDCSKYEWAINQSKYDYVSICNSNDYYFPNKIHLQMQYIKPDVVISTCGYIIMLNDFPQLYNFIHKDQNFIVSGIIPSTWLINKTLLKDKLYFPFRGKYHWDLIAYLEITLFGKVQALNYPLVFYNNIPVNKEELEQCTEEVGRFIPIYKSKVKDIQVLQ